MLKKLAFVCLVLALSVPTYAMTMTPWWDVGTVDGHRMGGDWQLDKSGNSPVFTTAALTQGSMTVGENNTGYYSDGLLQGLGQLFTPSSDISVKAISIKINGMNAGNYGLAIYDLGPSSNYTNVQPDPLDLSTYTPESSATYAFTAGTAQGQEMVAFNLYDGTFDLFTGEKYAFVITETHCASNDGLVWVRGNPQTGHMMITTNGGGGGMNVWKNVRDYGGSPTTDTTNYRVATLALYTDIVPEPATMALLGLGGLALLRRRK